jgi:transposase InsO family protein
MKTMPKNIKEERLRWIKPIVDGYISLVDMAKVCPFSERTLKRWKKVFVERGEMGLIPKSTRPKSCPNETRIRDKERVIELRKETNLGALKIHWKLIKEGAIVRPRTIGKIIKKEGLVRKYRTRKIRYKYVRAILQPGELVEIDIKYVPDRPISKRYYQFTAIDVASRWRYVEIQEEMANGNAINFLKKLLRIAPFKIKAIKTDNGSCFTNRYTGYLKSIDPFNLRLHQFDILCKQLRIEHYLIDPGKPNQNGTVERSHRTDQEHFYDRIKYANLEELRYKLRLWNMYYNDLEHCSLNGLTPNEALRLRGTNVCA